MFTGIIESSATIVAIEAQGTNSTLTLRAPITHELKVDQSLAHNGVCLTVTSIEGDTYTVTAVKETLDKTNLGDWKVGQTVNLERAMPAGGRLDGHFVQGHVDCTATCTEKLTLDGSWLFRFAYPREFAALLIEKGSICINGVSLTVFEVTDASFTVTIIPYTYTHTNFSELEAGNRVNLEFDVLGKYVQRIMALRQ
ncbi:MAG: riboflavin synthase [Chitinophagia bacterium]|nr:riboflavin synthase [Chitinophagia bacterium]